jgi:ABC-2 type transport system ATP-binding protein
MPIIEVRNLHKVYGSTVAVDDVSFEVEEGEIFGILGPNGAGKTTTVECVEGLRNPDNGTVRELDLDPQRHRTEITQRVGSQLQESGLQEKLKVWEALDLYSSFYDQPADWSELLDVLGLASHRNTTYRKLSGGQKQRIALARAILKDPSILILDDTTSSVDMETELRIQKTLKSIHQGKTCYIIAHRISSVKEAVLILVMDNGRIIEIGKHEELLKKKGYYYNVFKNQYGNFDEQPHGKDVIYINGTE